MTEQKQVLPEGYKQTEIGVIPFEWQVYRLSDIVKKVIDNRGKTPPLTRDGEYELIETASISFVGMYPDYTKVTKAVSRATYENWFRGHPKVGDVLISTVGEYSGASAILAVERGTIAQNLIAVRIYESIDPKFVFYWTRCELYRSQLEQVMMNQAQPSLRVPWLMGFSLPIPPIQEQTAIANALSDVDALIAELEKLIAKKQAIKAATMQQLLTGKTRLPEFALREDGTPKGYKASELGEIPEDWEVYCLPDVIWYQEGPGLRKWQFTSKGLKVINVTNLQESGRLELDRTDRHISWEEYEKTYKHFSCDESDLVIASSGNSYCKASIVRACDLPLLMNTSVIRFKPLSKFSKGFMDVYLRSTYFKEQIDLLITGGAQPNFGPAHLNKIKIPAPVGEEEQSAIATILTDMDEEIQTLQQRLNKTSQIKQGMMQELLTGKTRLIKGGMHD